MIKKNLIAMLASLLIGSFAFACAEEAPEDTIVNALDNVYAKVEKADDCDKLSKDLVVYCRDSSSEILDAVKELKKMDGNSENSAKELFKKVEKILKAPTRIGELEDTKCGKDEKVLNAISVCFDAIDFDLD